MNAHKGIAILLIAGISNICAASSVLNFTLLDKKQYRQLVNHSREKIRKILATLKPLRNQSRNEQVKLIALQLSDIPYLRREGMGEGDWQPASVTYQPGAVHLIQNPVYRLDGMDCQTFVQTAMALLYSTDLAQFDQSLLKIAYGAAGNPHGEMVRYFNRNNFVDGDFNPVNQHHGFLSDVTTRGALASSHSITANITRQKWFLYQQQNLAEHVRVLSGTDGPAMANRFLTVYSMLDYPRFDSESVTTSYIPKQFLAIRGWRGGYKPNQELLDKIPTPAVVEFVRDPGKWSVDGVNIKDLIGTETSISHFGLLYRQTFKYGEFIYHQITCDYNRLGHPVCQVKPIVCMQTQCHELMFAHATDAHPAGYYWYQNQAGKYVCTPEPPVGGKTFSYCNRVEQLPLFDYLTDYQSGSYVYMNMRSMLGIHIEKLT